MKKAEKKKKSNMKKYLIIGLLSIAVIGGITYKVKHPVQYRSPMQR